MSESPIGQLLQAVDALDVDAVMRISSPECRILTVDGQRAGGAEAVRAVLEGFVARLHSASHRVSAEWHEDNVWIAEVDAVYELADGVRLGPLARAFIVRVDGEQLVDVRVYGAHERPLDDSVNPQGLRVGGRWLPAL